MTSEVRKNYFKTSSVPVISIILGSGFEIVENEDFVLIERITFSEAGFTPKSRVKGHEYRISLFSLNGKEILIFHGRLHLYEGYSYKEVVFPVEFSKELGIGKILITSAAGGVSNNVSTGDLVHVRDHINLQGSNPIITIEPSERLRPFQDVSSIYNNEFSRNIRKIMEKRGCLTHSGVLAAVPGPIYETQAESRFLRTIGADMVSMSMIPEAIYSHYLGFQTAGLAAISNHHFKDNRCPDHNSILSEIRDMTPLFAGLLADIIRSC